MQKGIIGKKLGMTQLYPNNTAVLLHYADQLLLHQQAPAAIELLTPVADKTTEGWEIWKRLAQAWNQRSDTAQEAFAMAQAYASIGALKLALIQVDRAEKSLLNKELNTLKPKIAQLKTWLETQQKARENL